MNGNLTRITQFEQSARDRSLVVQFTWRAPGWGAQIRAIYHVGKGTAGSLVACTPELRMSTNTKWFAHMLNH